MTTINPTTLDRSGIASHNYPAIASAASLLGRLMISTLFLLSGIGKVTAPAATIGYIASLGLPLPCGPFQPGRASSPGGVAMRGRCLQRRT
jgi:uncharacterized membrane protein YphA (DoxX/SURF4 family)